MGAYGRADAFQIGNLPSDCFLVPVEDLKKLTSYGLLNSEEITTGQCIFPPKNAYFNSIGRGLRSNC